MAETPVEDIARVLLDRGISAVPVLGNSGELVGMVSEDDLVTHTDSRDGTRRSWWLDMIEKSTITTEGLQNYLESDSFGSNRLGIPDSGAFLIQDAGWGTGGQHGCRDPIRLIFGSAWLRLWRRARAAAR
jgi:hypothetical protein